MKKFIKTFILAMCLILPAMFCLTACGGENAKVSSFSVELANTSYTLVEDTIIVTYGEDYRLSANDFSVTATFDDETSKTLTASELEDFGFIFESNIPESAKTPAGTYEISIKHKDIEASKTISLVVEKATINYGESDVVWSASEFNYDGTEKTVTITNLPDTLKVTYQNNAKISPNENPNKYTATATISAKDSDNYNFAEITVEHTWEIKLVEYTITYTNTYGLTNNNETEYTLLDETITLSDLTGRDYYNFDGWYLNDEKITEIPKGFTGGDITLQAKWTAIEYDVFYNETKDVKNPNPTKYTIEDGEITLQPLPNRVDYTFVRWERDYDDYRADISPTTVISVSEHKGNLTLKAVWKRKTEYDAFTYTVSEDCLEATITGLTNESSTSITIPKGVVAIGDNAFKNCKTLTTVQFEEGSRLLTIGDYAFYFCGIRSITIPATVTEIGNYAFSRSGISEMNFAENGNLTTLGNSVFSNCSGLTEFTIPDSVTSMGMNVFSSCIYLTKVVFGKGMTVIGEYVYGGSSVLREIEFKGEITSFYPNALKSIATQNITLTLNWNQKYLEQVALLAPNGGTVYTDDYRAESGLYREKTGISDITQFCGKTFAGVRFVYDATDETVDEFSSSLSSSKAGNVANFKFILPASADNYFPVIANFLSGYANGSVTLTIDGATSIPAETFCKPYISTIGIRFKEVTIGDSVTSIGDNAFRCCSYLQKVTFGKGLTSLGEFAFYQCEKLKEIEIPDSVTSIGDNAFGYCLNLEKVTFGKGLTTLGKYAFGGCSELKEIEIPDSVISIGRCCFGDCKKLESIKLSASITELGEHLFVGCTSLKSLIIPAGVTEIGKSALQDCEALESVVIPKSVTTIDVCATYNCTALTTAYYTGTASEWSSITKGEYNDALTTATIYYYSATQPSTTGNYWHYVNDVPTAW